MHLTSHITHSNGYAPYIAYYRSNGVDQLFRKLKPKPKLNPPNAHRSQFAKIGKRKMCSFRSCQARFEFLSQFRKVRNAFECFVTQVQTRLPKTKCVWPMKINVICTVYVVWLLLHFSVKVLYVIIVLLFDCLLYVVWLVLDGSLCRGALLLSNSPLYIMSGFDAA